MNQQVDNAGGHDEPAAAPSHTAGFKEWLARVGLERESGYAHDLALAAWLECSTVHGVFLAKRLSALADVLRVQKATGNWDCNPYMHGMANGLILADSLLRGVQPAYLKAPEVWLDDLPNTGFAAETTNG